MNVLALFKNLLCTLLVISAFVLCGCAGTKEVLYDSGSRPKTDKVDVYRVEQKPTRSYKEIAEIQAEDFGGEEAEAIKRLINRARELGANAILLQPRIDTGYQFNPVGRSGNRYLFKAVAVVYE